MRCIFALAKRHGLVVQLVRIPACHAGGRGFESRPDREKPSTQVGGFFSFKNYLNLFRLKLTARKFKSFKKMNGQR